MKAVINENQPTLKHCYHSSFYPSGAPPLCTSIAFFLRECAFESTKVDAKEVIRGH